MRVNMDVSLSRSFNWWLAWPAVYPMPAYWPIQPYNAKGTITLHANGKVQGRNLDFTSSRTVSHNQFFYGFFIRNPMEQQLSQAYDQMFMELRDKVSGTAGKTAFIDPEPAPAPDPALTSRRQRVRNIAIMDLEPNSVDSSVSKVVADQLVADFLEKGRYNVLERQRIKDILKEQGFQQSGACDNQGCLVEVGKLLGVDAIVSGSVTQIKDLLVVNVRIVDVGTGVILFATQVRTEEGLAHLLSSDLKAATESF
jgi:TolB-like protein